MNMVNALFRDWDMKENPQYYMDGKDWTFFDKTMFGNTPGKRTNLFVGRYEDGSERYLKFGKQFFDFYELLANPLKKIGGKISPLPQTLADSLTGHSLSGYRNDDIYKQEGLKKALGIFKTVATAFVPLSIRKTMEDSDEFNVSDIMMQSSRGMGRGKAINYFKKAILDSDPQMIEETYMAALRNNLPAFTLFNNALAWIGAEESAELKKGVKDIEDVEAKMSVTESPIEKQRYGRILQRLKREKADIEQGSKLLKGALEKAKIYDSNAEIPRLGAVGTRLRAPEI
jgi:hypothetical protein